MAQLDEQNKLFGPLGDLVFKQINGKTIVQIKPGKKGVKQTGETKLAASDFGRASRITKCISQPLRSLFQTYHDPQMYNRLRKTVYKGMLANTEIPKGEKNLYEGNITLLEGFEFNIASLYTDYCSVPVNCSITSNQEIQLEIAEFIPRHDLVWFDMSTKAELTYFVTVYEKETYRLIKEEFFKIKIPFSSSHSEAQIFTTAPLPSSCLVIVSSSVFYFKSKAFLAQIPVNQKTFHPARIQKVFRIDEEGYE